MSRLLSPWRSPGIVGAGESMRVERVIALSRLVLAVIAGAAIGLTEVEPVAYAPVATLLAVGFAAHGVAAFLSLRRRPGRSQSFAVATHAIDLVAAALTLPLVRPNSLFFTFFLFVLASSAFRWGFRGRARTTLAAVVLMLLHFGLFGDGDVTRLLLRIAYLMMMGFLLGYLAAESRLLRAEAAAVVRLLGRIREDANVSQALATAATDTVQLFDASHLLLVVEELPIRRVFRWDTLGGWSLVSAGTGESSATDRAVYFFGPMDHSLAVRRRGRWWGGSRQQVHHEVLAIDQTGRLVEQVRVAVPAAFVAAHPFTQLILAPVRFGGEWSGRVFVFEPRADANLLELAEFLQTVIHQVTPAVLSVHLLNRLQERAGAVERARVARELHDGVIQSLVGIEMQIEVLRGQEAFRSTAGGAELARIQHLVREEMLNVRDLMQQMRPAEFDPEELLDHFADLVQRFGRDTGLATRFVTSLRTVSLERRVCFELVRILQEALTNVRRHAGATHVMVRFDAWDGAWRLEIGDDGRGFPFDGALSLDELDARHLGPTIIKERVRDIGGRLIVHSKPGGGSHLEVLIPQEDRA